MCSVFLVIVMCIFLIYDHRRSQQLHWKMLWWLQQRKNKTANISRFVRYFPRMSMTLYWFFFKIRRVVKYSVYEINASVGIQLSFTEVSPPYIFSPNYRNYAVCFKKCRKYRKLVHLSYAKLSYLH